LSQTSVDFVLAILEMESCELFCQGHPWTEILLISASKVARIIDESH
jgi:hypothetical protein